MSLARICERDEAAAAAAAAAAAEVVDQIASDAGV